MAVAEPVSHLITYEEYMAEPETSQRTEIIEGVRYVMSAPTWDHQGILGHIYKLLDRYGERTGRGYARPAAVDVLIRRTPRLQVRQPDVLFITHERLALGGGRPRRGPLEIAPELVVEILSDSEREATLKGKLTDYASIGAQEAWVVRPEGQTVEMIRLGSEGSPQIFTASQNVQSAVFPDLSLAVADFFKP